MQSTSSRPPVTVSIVARLPIQQHGIGALVEQSSDFMPGQVVTSIDQVRVGSGPRPHVIVYYLNGRGACNPELITSLVEQGLEVIILVSKTSSLHAASMIRLGVRGVVGCGVDGRELTSAIRHVATGNSYISSTVANDLLMNPREAAADKLTSREQEILVRVAAGETDREIARTLYIAIRTVRSHLDNIRKKTGQRRRPDLTRYAIVHGLWPAAESDSDPRLAASTSRRAG
jgi:DNA-binding NarL/FixJ family response regulator